MNANRIVRVGWIGVVLAVLAAALPASAGLIYMCDTPEGTEGYTTLHTVNPSNGSATEVGRVKAGESDVAMQDIVYSAVMRVMYGTDGHSLYTLDFENPVAGVVTATFVAGIANLNGDSVRALTVSASGVLYAGTSAGTPATVSGALYTLGPTSGNATLIGSLGTYEGQYLQDVALAMSASGQLYGVAYALADTTHPNRSWFADIDAATAGVTPKAALTGEQWLMTGMTFAGGNLYGGDWSGNFYSIDPATGATTLLGNNGKEMQGLTFVPEPAGMLPMAVCVSAWLVLRRRKR